jgi:hypothetical protein
VCGGGVEERVCVGVWKRKSEERGSPVSLVMRSVSVIRLWYSIAQHLHSSFRESERKGRNDGGSHFLHFLCLFS